jgi:GT2 family glycosyltransferase
MIEKSISIAIPTYNRNRILKDTINQVLGYKHLLLEILIIDQTEIHDAETETYLYEKKISGEIIHIIQYPPNLPAARNRALKESKADIIIFIDDDIILGDNFVEEHHKNYEDDKVVAVAGRVRQRLGWPPINRPKRWKRLLDYRYFYLNSNNRVEGIANFPGGNHSIKIEIARLLGGYDENYFGSGLREETDMAIRLANRDYNIVYDPLAELYHLSAPSGGCRKVNIFDASAGRCLLYFAIKHLNSLKTDVLYDFKRALRIMVFNKQNLKRPFVLIYMALKFGLLLLYFLASKHNFNESKCTSRRMELL